MSVRNGSEILIGTSSNLENHNKKKKGKKERVMKLRGKDVRGWGAEMEIVL